MRCRIWDIYLEKLGLFGQLFLPRTTPDNHVELSSVCVPNPVPSALPMFYGHLCTYSTAFVASLVQKKLYQFDQLYHLYRTSFTSCTVPVLPVPKSAPNRAHQKNNAHFAENDTNFTENNAHFTKNKANILVQYSQRTDSVQYSGSVRLVHSVRYSWCTWCSTNGTFSAALVIQLAQYKHQLHI